MTTAGDALQQLKEGNQRYVRGSASHHLRSGPTHRDALVGGQKPFAVVVGCSDSRVPPEIVFDQGLGDLFVIRVAGNVLAPSQIGSIEFGVSHLNVPLVVILGHLGCGAIKATWELIHDLKDDGSPHLKSITDPLRKSMAELMPSDLTSDFLHRAAVANVRASIEHLKKESQLVTRKIQDHALAVVGAIYSLETGQVTFFDDLAGKEPPDEVKEK